MKIVVVRRKWEWCTNWMWCAVNDKNLHEIKTSLHIDWLVVARFITKSTRTTNSSCSSTELDIDLTSGRRHFNKCDFFFFFVLLVNSFSNLFSVRIAVQMKRIDALKLSFTYSAHKLRRILSALDCPHLQRVILWVYSNTRYHVIGNAIIWKFVVIISNHLSRNQFHAITRLPSADKLRRRQHCNPSEK